LPARFVASATASDLGDRLAAQPASLSLALDMMQIRLWMTGLLIMLLLAD